jgi:hypothetical protein
MFYATRSTAVNPRRSSRARRTLRSARRSLCPRHPLKPFAASRTPDTAQRSTMRRPRQRYTLRCTSRTRPMRFSMVLVVASMGAASARRSPSAPPPGASAAPAVSTPRRSAAGPRGDRPARAAGDWPPCDRRPRPRSPPSPPGGHALLVVLIPRAAQRPAILLQHRLHPLQARVDDHVPEFRARVDQEVDHRQWTLPCTWDTRGSCDRRLLHSGSFLGGLRLRLGHRSYSTTSEEPPLSHFNSYWDITSGIRAQGFGLRDSGFGIRDSGSGIRD